MMFTRFTKEPRQCVEAAVEEARMLGHDSIGDEDLLLGSCAPPQFGQCLWVLARSFVVPQN